MAKNDIWKCKDGKTLKMCEMTDSHLNNAIKLFRLHKKDSPERWDLLWTEKKRRAKVKEKSEPDDPIDSRFDILDL